MRSPGHGLLLNYDSLFSKISQYKEVAKIGHRKLILYGCVVSMGYMIECWPVLFENPPHLIDSPYSDSNISIWEL